MSGAHPESPPGGDGCSSIQVGTTGTIASLMSRELDNVEQTKTAAFDLPPLKSQSAPVSVSCGATPRRLQFRRYPSTDAGSSSGNRTEISGGVSGRIGVGKAQESQKRRQRRAGNGVGSLSPMLTPDRAVVQEVAKRKVRTEKSAHSLLVEVVDLKCNNPMSGRLRKLGFSKLSESIA